MLKVLIVEDSRDRQDILKNLFKDHAWVMVHTAARAVCLLHQFDFDLVSLDYDIAGEEKGSEIAAALQETRNKDAKVLVHSMNHMGSEEIKAILPEAIVVPISKITRNNATFKRLKEELNKGLDIDWAYVFRQSE